MYAQEEGFGKPFLITGRGEVLRAQALRKTAPPLKKYPPSKTFRLYTIITTFFHALGGLGAPTVSGGLGSSPDISPPMVVSHN